MRQVVRFAVFSNAVLSMSAPCDELRVQYSSSRGTYKEKSKSFGKNLHGASDYLSCGLTPEYTDLTAPAPTAAPNFFSTRSGKPSWAV